MVGSGWQRQGPVEKGKAWGLENGLLRIGIMEKVYLLVRPRPRL